MAETKERERPRCRCHGEPMRRDRASNGGWRCAVRARARELAAYHADPVSANYKRYRRALRARIAWKRQRIEELRATLWARSQERRHG